MSQKTAALKICDFGVYIFIFVDFREKSSVSWKPKDLKINSKLMALFHWEQLYRAKDQFPKKLVLCLVNIILSFAPRGTQYSHSSESSNGPGPIGNDSMDQVFFAEKINESQVVNVSTSTSTDGSVISYEVREASNPPGMEI